MGGSRSFVVKRLGVADAALMDGMLAMFADAFEERATYNDARPGAVYMRDLLGSRTFIALAAIGHDSVVGGLAAYELRKFERERSEIYIYDLAVDEAHRRRGIATALIEEVRVIAAERGAWVIFVQADHGDDPAIALYTKIGKREDVLHFDIPPRTGEEMR